MKGLASYTLISYLVFCLQANGQVGMISVSAGPASNSPKTSPPQSRQLVESYGKLALSFEANTGQADRSVKFISRGSGYGLYLTDKEAVLALDRGDCGGLPTTSGGQHKASSVRRLGLSPSEAACAHQTGVVRMQLEGSKPVEFPKGEDQLPGTANYFIGSDPAKWHTGVPTYGKVRYRSVYPGVDLVYYGNQRQLEYDFVIAPGSDPKAIRLRFAGAKGLRLADGDLVVTASGGAMAVRKPVVFQVVNGQRKPVAGGFTLLAKHTVGFRVASYDSERPLVIDPVLVYSTYLGGASSDGASGIVTDAAGAAYVIGYAGSTDFPITNGAFQTTNHAMADCGETPFVTKFNPTGSALVYSTYLGGSDCDYASGLAVDGSGNAYITGNTTSPDFPVTQGAFQTTTPINAAVFVSKLNATGSALIYSTYLGGISGADSAHALAVDGSGNAYVAGAANDTGFPVTQGAYQTTLNIVPSQYYGIGDGTNAFVTKLNPAGSALVYSTYLGGSGGDFFNYGDGASALAVDSGGNAYVVGLAHSADFPVTAGAFQTTNNTGGYGYNAFVTKVNPSATQTANVTEIIRDQNGNQLASRTFTLAPLNHTSFNPTFPSGITGGGVVEYDSNVNLFGLGIRSAPEGTGLAFTSVRAAYK